MCFLQEAGTELFDTKWWNQQPVTLACVIATP